MTSPACPTWSTRRDLEQGLAADGEASGAIQ
jgi:hypothetical protein